jgi:NAD-dependent deacetylase
VIAQPDLLAQAKAILQNARSIVALTGAGISTPSGIPDFRSPESGVWENVDPIVVASIYAFNMDPHPFFEWIRPLAKLTIEAQPNPAHIALANMEKYGTLKSVITQNIDLLHSRAGSKTVHEVHGHLREATCVGCKQIAPLAPLMPAFIANGDIPLCPACGSVYKPNVILFGELLPMSILKQAQADAEQCDVMIVAGSSLQVSPAGDLPLLAKKAGAKLIFVNFSRTHLDHLADVVFHEDVVEVLPQLAAVFAPHGVS